MISKQVLMILAIAFCVVISVTNVKSHYVPDYDQYYNVSSEEDDSNEQGTSKVAEFFDNIKCGLSHGAKKIKDGFTSGYEYIKKKLTPGSTTDASPSEAEVPANVTEIDLKPIVPVAPIAPVPSSPPTSVNNGPVTFPTVATARSEGPPVWDIDVRAFINETDDKFPEAVIESTTPVNISLDDRALFDAPSFCPDGQMKDRNGRCRKIS